MVEQDTASPREKETSSTAAVMSNGDSNVHQRMPEVKKEDFSTQKSSFKGDEMEVDKDVAAKIDLTEETDAGGADSITAPPKTVTVVLPADTFTDNGSNYNSAAESSAVTATSKLKKKKGHKHTQSNSIPFIPAASERIRSTAGDGSDLQDQTDDRVRLGICAMDKKARSKAMAEILSRLDEEAFHVVFFGDDMILNKPIEEWPTCHVLIAFYSKGYPLDKAMEYVELRKPFTLNNLAMQKKLKDRRAVYDLLADAGIDTPRHVYLSRDDYVSTGKGEGNGNGNQEVVEHDDHIEVNGITIHKPFVEKPVDADDHNIAIYYPTSAGGGCKKLFRKIGNRSSEFYPDINEVRRDGSYIYEEFVETQGTDVKMYTVGPEYGHAEARKSPTVDGKVERNSEGKEVRFPVILTLREKEIARRIVLVFKQFVCGFDLLRVQVKDQVVSYVCDVNGFSFVKNSRKYYDDCAQILMEHILATCKPGSSVGFSTLDPLIANVNRIEYSSKKKGPRTIFSRATRMLQGAPAEDEADSDDDNEEGEGRCKKGKTRTPTSPFRSSSADVLATAAATLVDGAVPVREIPNQLASEPASMCPSETSSQVGDFDSSHARENRNDGVTSMLDSHEEELRCVIAVIRHGDRTPKQKLKVKMNDPLILKYFHKHSKDCTKELKVKAKGPMIEFLETVRKALNELDKKSKDGSANEKDKSLRVHLRHIRDILERWRIAGMNRKLQLKPSKWEEYTDEDRNTKKRCISLQLVFKYGGNLTRLGENQALRLGRKLRRDAYPDSGGGILRLHSTFRHDLKIKTSDEGRVMKTAAAFAKGLLELEGDLPPILVSLVHKEKGSMHMLDPSGNKSVKKELDECKERITANLQKDIDIANATIEEREQLVGPRDLEALHKALMNIGNPRKALMKIHRLVGDLIDQLEDMLGMIGSGDEKQIEGAEGLKGDDENDVALSGVKLYKGETLLELTERWRFLYKNLYDADEDKFDLSRIPDVHDNVRFDVLHNPHLGLSNTLEELYILAKDMADCVVPQEYGTTFEEKRSVGAKISSALLEKIMYDLKIARADNEVDMRYMINLEYTIDLPITTMGRRVRTRLYFTSESHLHTMLNVLRFAKDRTSVLSEEGVNILNDTGELCYLTQILLRLFEDRRWEMDDPRRYRVEILFSPGAEATPLHMHEQDRDSDPSRFDTAPLQMIGRDGLTCQELEDFFHAAIEEGGPQEALDTEDTQKLPEATEKEKAVNSDKGAVESITNGHTADEESKPNENPIVSPENTKVKPEPERDDSTKETVDRKKQRVFEPADSDIDALNTKTAFPLPNIPNVSKPDPTTGESKDDGDNDGDDSSVVRNLERKYFWSTVAVGSFILATSCLVLALNLSISDSRRSPRKHSTRRY